MKKLLVFVASMVCCISLFAKDGMLWKAKDVKVVSTEWFDIVYPPECKTSATILYENADRVYDEIAEMYGTEQRCRMPVVITPYVEEFNAYWTNSYYNHIVLYDTALISDLSVFSETILSTFRHELTHAYTYNLTSPFWQGIQKVFGDSVSLPGLNITSGWAEGATLTSESAQGEGRLNNDFTKQVVRQSKIEGIFPYYSDVQGASNLYPAGKFYYFNGAFDQWLQENYGMELYARFWYNAISVRYILTSRVFKKTYGISLRKAWKQFQKDYSVPEIPGNPVEAGVVKDLFTPEQEEYSIKNVAGNLFEHLTASEKGYFYIQRRASAVYFISKEDLAKQDKIKSEKLFTLANIESIKASSDGKYLVINYYSTLSPVITSKLAVYDVEAKRLVKLEGNSKNDPSIVISNGEYYLVYSSFISQNYTVTVERILTEKGKVCGTEKVSEKTYPFEVFPYSYADCQNGNFAYILKRGLNFSIVKADLEQAECEEYSLPYSGMVVRYLSTDLADKDCLLFSWTEPGTMPRAGRINFAKDQYELSEKDISGGIFYPVSINDSELAYVGHFYKINRLLKVQKEFFIKEELSAIKYEPLPAETEETTDIDSLSKNYNPFNFYKKGLLIPFPSCVSKAMSPFEADAENNGNYILGIQYATKNPWDGNVLRMSLAYSPLLYSGFGYNFSYGSGTDTSLLYYSLNLGGEFDYNGWKQNSLNASVSSVIPVGNYSDMFFQLTSLEDIGHQTTPINFLNSTNAFVSYFTSIHYSGSGRYEKLGFLLGAEVYYSDITCLSLGQSLAHYGDAGIFGKLYIPKLLPVTCIDGFTYNFPAKVGFSIFDSSAVHSLISPELLDKYPDLGFAYAEVLLFGCDIEKGDSLLNLYFLHDFRFSAGCIAGLSTPAKFKYTSWRVSAADQLVNAIGSGEAELTVAPVLKATFGISFGVSSTPRQDVYAAVAFPDLTFTKSPAVLKVGVESQF